MDWNKVVDWLEQHACGVLERSENSAAGLSSADQDEIQRLRLRGEILMSLAMALRAGMKP